MSIFEEYIEKTGVYGTVTEVKHPIVTIKGLPAVRPNELVVFSTNQLGFVNDIDHDVIRALVLSNQPVEINAQATRTQTQIQIPVGLHLLGKTVDPLVTNISKGTQTTVNSPETRLVFSEAPSIDSRIKINKSFITGVSKVDLLVPLGYGQRELILGDVKTGKTTLILSILQYQLKETDSVAIYTAIGKRRVEIKLLEEQLTQYGIRDKVLIVASHSSDAPSIQYLAPHAAMSHAEYFRDKGLNSIIIFDDLTTHAQCYRELSLLSKRFPGRDSYPGDIFYTHANLLERAGNFIHPEKKEASITCLPLATTIEGDMTGYISTNLMGMTDGHILFDTDIYTKGTRPAINIPLSVTRVGRQTQNDLLRQITVKVLSTLTAYEKILNISHLGSELSTESKDILKKGKSLETIFQQDQASIPRDIQVILFGLVWENLCDLSIKKAADFILNRLLNMYADPLQRPIITRLTQIEKFSDFLIALVKTPEVITICSK